VGREQHDLWTTVTLAAFAVLAGCASPVRGQHQITVVFPALALQEATSRVELQLFRQGSAVDHCARLTRAISARQGLALTIELVEVRGCCRAGDSSCSGETTLACYDGAEATRARGACRAGTATCAAGLFTTCVGQVLPQAELCNGVDDDCDGVVDNVPPAQLASDRQNCGRCGRVCKSRCAGGVCDQIVDAGPPDGRVDAVPRPPARWDTVAPMKQARARHTATTLADGTVLVVGGSLGYLGGLKTAERYDPQTNSWSSAGTMAQEHWGHEAVLLQDGRVLVVAGCAGEDGYTCMVGVGPELYDPQNSAAPWKTAAPALSFRRSHRATLLGDGRVLVVGGYASAANDTTLELYDPVKDLWSSPGATLGVARNLATATTLKSGKVLIAGGTDGTLVHATLELFDPVTGTIKVLGAKLAAPRFQHTATLLLDGRVLFVGGDSDVANGRVKNAEIYDPSTDSVVSAGSPGGDAFQHTATRLLDGRVLVVGGVYASDLTRIYEPAINSWYATALLSTNRDLHAASLTGERVIVTGGALKEAPPITGVEIYTP